MKKLTLFLGILFLINTSIIGQTPDELMPDDNEIQGWVHDTGSSCFEGVATDCTSLFDIINGGAEKYTDRGFVAGAFRGYTDRSEEICIEIFDQANSNNARAVYQLFGEEGTFVNVPSLGDSAHIDTVTYLSAYYLELISHNFFLRLISPNNDQYKQSMLDIAHHIVGVVPIIEDPVTKKSSLTNNPFKISVHPTNGGYVFKITINSASAEELHTPEINIYNSKGLLIRKLLVQQFGTNCYTSAWDGKNQKGVDVANGQYTVILRKNGIVLSKSFMKEK